MTTRPKTNPFGTAMRGRFRPPCTTLLVSCLALVGAAPALAQENRPNILLILLDDVGFMDFSAYGGDTRTPAIDRLAGQGAMFSRFYTSPQCGPSRAMILTGMDNHQTGMGSIVETLAPEMREYPGYTMRWQADQETIATRLSDVGYQTYAVGKWGIGDVTANLPGRFGFDRSFVMDSTGGNNYDNGHYLPGYSQTAWFEDDVPTTLPDDFYSSRSFVDRMIEYVDAGDPERPFFGFLSFQAIHIPLQVSPDYIDRYNGVFDAGWDAMRQDRLAAAIDRGLVPPTTTLAQSPESHRSWSDLSEPEQQVAARLMQLNAGMMEAADEQIGRLLAHLETTGQLDNTLVIVTSDNGPEAGTLGNEPGLGGAFIAFTRWLEGVDMSPEAVGQRDNLAAIGPEWALVSAAPFHLYKFTAGEGGMRVPLVIAGPGIAADALHGGTAHVTDLVPTMLEAAGVPYEPETFFGRSLMPVLTGRAEATYGPGDGLGMEVGGNAAYYLGDWKLARVSRPHGDSRWRLFDLATDPGETTDLAVQQPVLFHQMLNDYRDYARSVGVIDLGPDASPNAQLDATIQKSVLRRYWYLFLAALGLVLVALASAFMLMRFARRKAIAKPT